MRRYQKYISHLYYSFFFRVLAFVSVVIICTKCLNLLQKTSQGSALSLKFVSIIFLTVIPYVITSITPFASAIACVIVVNSMLSSSQILVLQNCGVKRIQVTSTFIICFIPVSIFLLFIENFLLPQINSTTQRIQNSIVQEQTKDITLPNQIKQIGNITLITSPLNEQNSVEKTFIHKKTDMEQTLFVGKIQQSWSLSGLLGFSAKNATIFTENAVEGNSLMQFENLEIQIEVQDETAIAHLKGINTFLLIEEYFKEKHQATKERILRKINSRITPCLLVLLLPFCISTMMVRNHQARVGLNAVSILKTILFATFCLLLCYEGTRAFSKPSNFYLLYLNIFLTFTLLYFLNQQNFRFFKKQYV